MMFRYGKIIESNAKTSRSDRFAEMSKQQQLIESKKQEIKAKFEERKRQDAAEALKQLSNKSSSERKSNKDRKLLNSRMQSWKNDDRWRKKNNSEQSESAASNDFFSNDGSFLEKYKKLASNESSDVNNSSKLEHSESIRISDSTTEEENDTVLLHLNYDASRDCRKGIPFPPPNINMHPVSTSQIVASHHQSLYSLTSHPPPSAPPPPSSSNMHTALSAVPVSVPLLTAVPSSGTSLQTVSLIQVPVSVPASSVIFSCPLETTLVTSEPIVHLPVVHSTLAPNSISVPLQTTVIPAQIQITSPASAPPSSVQAVQINQSSTNVILSQTLQPQSILVPSECIQQSQASNGLPNTNVPPPPIQPSRHFQAPPSVHSMYSPMPQNSSIMFPVAQQSGNTPLPPMHIMPPPYTLAPHQAAEIRGFPDFTSSCKTSQFNKENDDIYEEKPLITSVSDDPCERFQNQNHDESRSVDKRSSGGIAEMETVASIVADCGDDMEEILLRKYPDDEKLWFLKYKLSPAYIAFRNLVEKLRKKVKKDTNENNLSLESSVNEHKSSQEHCSLSKVPADEDYSESEDMEGRKKRKRKRRSRWAPEDTKVEIQSIPAIVSNSVSGIGVAIPSGLGSVVPVTTPVQNPQTKIPGLSGPIISQVSRADPALLQYALKSFGTLHLSDEDWMKAEDHYKINLLYQDMLKKRQELERLQAAGKHKYAYDSDEDTQGGTWEHKLRQQEMLATTLWADELTERAKGKHHIGDFLPPDELERFMEKYDALKEGREPDLSDYKEYKLKEDNIGFQMLQKLGWSEGQGLGSDGSGIVNPVNKAPSYAVNHGLGIEKPDDVSRNDDEYDAYRKRMMLAYRFRPNPLNNPRRPYY